MNVVGECFRETTESFPRGESPPPITVGAGEALLSASYVRASSDS